jgi:hypothetical protein
MTLGSTRRHAFMAAAGALLCGLLASTFAMAQSSQLEDLVGIWATKYVNGPTFYYVYQATTGPGSLTLRYVRTDIVTTLPGVSSGDKAEKLYQLTVNDRSLSGTVTMDSGLYVPMGCPFERRTFPVQGRISPDWNTITIVENHESPWLQPCGWQNFGERVLQFERYH